MGIGYLIYNGVLIAVDCFSAHHNAMKAGEVRELSPDISLKAQIYYALSGRLWDGFIERIDREYREVDTWQGRKDE